MYPSLIETSKPMLRYKGQLWIAFAGWVVMSLSFGAGIGLLLPVFNFLLKEDLTLGQLADKYFNGPLEGMGDWIADTTPTDQFWGFMLVMTVILVATIISGIGRFIQTFMVVRVMMRVIQWWRIRLFRKMVRMQMKTYWLHGADDGASRIMTDVEALRTGFQSILIRSLQALGKVLIAMSVAFIINWKLTLLALVGGPILALVVRKFGKSIRKASKGLLEAKGDMLGRMHESLGDLRVVKMSQSEGAESRKFQRASQRMYREEVRRFRVRAVSSLVVEVVAMIGIILVAGLSAWNIFRNNVSGSEFMAILAALVAAAASFKPLSNLHHDLTAADAAAQRLIELKDRLSDSTINDRSDRPKLPRHRATVRFEQLTYAYPDAAAPALDHIDLEVDFGQMIAVVGGNGSGKSTLVAALARLIEPESGRILIDGHDIREHDLRSVRGQMAMVTQKTKLFKGTIAENIAYGRLWARHESLVAAAKAATADLFIDEMPEGYDTPIGEGGEGVSGGQAQRLCIARAVLRDPAILILDEATSQVDTRSEALIAKAMEQITEGRTTFVIAHRMSTIVHADRIIVMDAGRIVGQGKHDELLTNCPQYAALANGQLAGAAPDG